MRVQAGHLPPSRIMTLRLSQVATLTRIRISSPETSSRKWNSLSLMSMTGVSVARTSSRLAPKPERKVLPKLSGCSRTRAVRLE